MGNALRGIELSPAEWTDALKTVSGCNLFHTDEWLRVLEESYECKVLRLGFVKGTELAGAIPVPLRRKFIYRVASARGLATPYAGPLARDATMLGSVFEAFWEYAQSQHWDYVEVATDPASSLREWRSMDSTVTRELHRTICVSLDAKVDELFRRMESRCRGAVRKAERSGVEIRWIEPGSMTWVDPYFDMARELYRAKNRPPQIPRVFFESLWRILGPSGRARVVFALHDNELIAAGVFLVHGDTLYYCDAVSKSQALQYQPNNLIQWNVMQWAAAEGLRRYDMLGADIPSIARFKEGFGGQYVGYTSYRRSGTWLARLGERAYHSLVPLARALAVRLQRT